MNTYERDFFAEAHTLLKQQGYKNYITKLLPNGKWQGNEYVVKNPTRNDNKAGSFSINGVTGKWADFATNEAGNDLIGLTSLMLGISPVEACYHIGVPKLENNDPKTSVEAHTVLNSHDDAYDFTVEDTELTDAAIEELEQEAIVNVDTNKLTEEELHPAQPPNITDDDVHYHSSRTFKCKPSYFYEYKNTIGVTVGYIVRWELEQNGIKTKGTRPYIYDWDKQKWVSRFFGTNPPKSRPLYNLPEILAKPDSTILIVEGEKTAEAAKKLFPDYVVTTSSGGASQANNSEWQCLKNRKIIISPDGGEAGASYSRTVLKILRKQGIKSIAKLDPNKLGEYVIKDGKPTKRNTAVPHGYDLADSLEEGWTAELIEEVQNNQDFAPFFRELPMQKIIETELKAGEEVYDFGEKRTYKLSPNGLYLRYFVQASSEDCAANGIDELDSLLTAKESWIPLCGYLKPVYKIWDENNSWGALVRFKNINGEERELFLKRTDWLGEKGAIEILQDQGLLIRSLAKSTFDAINEYLQFFQPEKEAIGVEKVGWQGNNEAYMLPFVDDPRNCYIVPQADKKTEYILQQKTATPRTLHKKGTLKEWQRTVGAITRGNHLHCFAIIAALTAPILKLMNEEGGFFHYVGNTSVGKSTILHLAKSVYGYVNLGSFRTTDNALESVCKNSNDGSVFLDEIGESDPDAFFKMIYMLANGVTKDRANRNGDSKGTTFFTVLAQSTGEVGIEAKLAEKRIQAKGGQLIRMAELDADRGKGFATFDLLKLNPDTEEKFKNGAEQAEYLKLHARENCGVVIDAFLSHLVEDLDTYINGIKDLKETWTRQLKTIKGQPEIDRMIKRFSTIYATGVTASVMGVLPYTKDEITECVNSMFDNWLVRRGGDTPHEFNIIVRDLYKLCIENQHSRFQDADGRRNTSTFIKDKAGFFKEDEEVDQEASATATDEYGNPITRYKYILREFWIRPRAFDEYVLKGRDKKAFLPLLVNGGYLKQNKRNENTLMKRPKNEPPQCFYVVPVEALLDLTSENIASVNTDNNNSEQQKNGVVIDGVFRPVKM